MTHQEWRRQQAEIRRHPPAATDPRPQPSSFYGPPARLDRRRPEPAVTAAILRASVWVFLGTFACVLGLIALGAVIANGNQTSPRRPGEDGRGEGGGT